VRLGLSLIVLRHLLLLLLLVILHPLPLVEWTAGGLGHLLLSHWVSQLLLLEQLVGGWSAGGRSRCKGCLVGLEVWVRRGV
jgi:hypothetical protein